MTSVTTKNRVQEYLVIHSSDPVLNASEIGRTVGTSRQRVCQILDSIGETRHKRQVKALRHRCPVCEIPISRNAKHCKEHSVKRQERKEGFNYLCRSCSQYKPLEQFAKSNRHFSGYETRCLICKAEWQRRYNQTRKGKESHLKANRRSSRKYPERVRAYYQVYKSVRSGNLVPAEQCEERGCRDTNVRASHTDYNKPLEVRWLCALHTRRTDTPRVSHVSSKLETQFRGYIFEQIDHTNSATRWINALKRYYCQSDISYSLLIDAINSPEPIPGLGRQFKIKARRFLDSIIKSLD
ncbi:hypothetical protein CMI37_06095 [Candidatus Pacearchaeota archaeon]|nr:hypothetical protein [Candidatus Pacearchaeota archaeon]